MSCVCFFCELLLCVLSSKWILWNTQKTFQVKFVCVGHDSKRCVTFGMNFAKKKIKMKKSFTIVLFPQPSVEGHTLFLPARLFIFLQFSEKALAILYSPVCIVR
uniref:(northern house mosquito) hypothetical protein n=1 Tax=Culex pipiens TaxID=7175 RepID=A0A8D8ESF5_CULPI